MVASGRCDDVEHGAGCCFSVHRRRAGQGGWPVEAFKTANAFVRAGLKESFALNQHVGPIYHKALAKGL